MKTYKKYLLTAAAVSAVVAQMMAGYASAGVTALTASQPQDLTKDTIVHPSPYPQPSNELVTARIQMLARAYGDSIVLRWAGEDYVTQRSLYNTGVDIYRIDKTEFAFDTLAHNLKPYPLNALRQIYPESDSIAYAAMGLIYDENFLQPDQIKAEPGSLEALMELNDDQQTHFGFTVLMSEWRTDIADRIAMRLCDRNVIPGHHYEYILQPSWRNDNANLIMGTGHIADIENVPYKRLPFFSEIPDDLTNSLTQETLMGDTIVGPHAVRLWWRPQPYSTYEIERRKSNELTWTRVNEHPHLMMSMTADGDDDHFYKDLVPEAGDYEYRVFAHDPFGDLTLPSPIHKVHVPDILGPQSPTIRSIEITHTDPADMMKGVKATFHIMKDSLESDFAGYLPLYHHPKITGNDWKPLIPQTSPLGAQRRSSNREPLNLSKDTVITVDVTGLITGTVTVAAYDNAGNASYALPTLLQLQDVKAPEPPYNLTATTDAESGTVTLTWDADDDDIEYFEVAYANDTTHNFVLRSTDKNPAKTFVDTLDTYVNQRYIYYKVRAVDYSTNVGNYTPVLQVQRPSNLIPSQPHIDSTWVNDEGIHMRWACPDEQQIDEHRLYRRLEKSKKKSAQWQLIGTFPADSVRNAGHVVTICDAPEYLRTDRYVYAMESVSCNGHTSGKSLGYSVAWEGDLIFKWPINLMGEYNEKAGETKIAWDCTTPLPYKGEWYFCIWRKGPKDDRFKFLISSAPNEMLSTDRLLRPGEEAEYYVMIQYADGRESLPSNIITVKAPKK